MQRCRAENAHFLIVSSHGCFPGPPENPLHCREMRNRWDEGKRFKRTQLNV